MPGYTTWSLLQRRMLAYLFSLGSEGQCDHDSSCFNVSRQKSPAMLALKYLFSSHPLTQPDIQLPPSHQPRCLPAAVVPAKESQRLWPHASSHSTVAIFVLCSSTPPHCITYVLPQQHQLRSKQGNIHVFIF